MGRWARQGHLDMWFCQHRHLQDDVGFQVDLVMLAVAIETD